MYVTVFKFVSFVQQSCVRNFKSEIREAEDAKNSVDAVCSMREYSMVIMEKADAMCAFAFRQTNRSNSWVHKI